MSASEAVRRHEAGHAIAAVALGVELREPALALTSDQEACINVAPPASLTPDEAWYIRRVAVKLAGPIALIRSRGQAMDWQTLREESEYATDLNEAERILQKFWLDRGFGAAEHLVSEQLNRAASFAIQCIDQNEGAITALIEATESEDAFCFQQILDAIAGYSPLNTPRGIG
jgi:hypothetical protein